MPYTPRYKKEIFQELIAIVVAQSELTDVNPGSVLTHLLGSVASEMELVEFRLKEIRDSFSLDDATGMDLDYRIRDLPPAGLSRQGASHAQGSVISISFATALESELVIPAGSSFSAGNAEGIYTTTSSVTVPAGSTAYPSDVAETPYISVICSIAGPQGNLAQGLINTIVSAPSEITSVTNPIPISGGKEMESDGNFRQRAKSYLASLSRITSGALEHVVRSYTSPAGEQARHVGVSEDPLTPGFTEVVVDPGSGGLDESLLNFPQASTVLDPGEEYSWTGQMPSVLYHNMCALEEIKMSDIQIAIYDKDNKYGLGFGKVVVNFDHESVRSFYGIPQDVNPFISVHERGHLYTDSFFPMNFAPNFGYDEGIVAEKVFMTKPVEITLKPFIRYVGLISDIQRLIEGDPNDPSLYPGYRPAGCRVVAKLPLIQNIGSMKINLTLNESFLIGDIQEDVRFEVASIVADLGPGELLRRADIISRLMGLSYVNNVEIISPTDDVDTVSARHSLRIKASEITLS